MRRWEKSLADCPTLKTTILTMMTPLSSNQRLEDSRRHAHSAKRRSQVEQEVQAGPTEVQGVATATEAAVSVGTMTEDVEESSGLKELLSQLEEGRAELQETLSHRE